MVVTQPIMQAHEDLAALFSRNMILEASKVQPIHFQEQPRQEQAAVQSPEAETIIYSISQHYHHSAHIVAPVPTQPERPASEPPQSEHQTLEAILTSHGVDPAGLSQSQAQLFREADDAQKLRLLELWRIYPPTSARESNPALAWTSTSIDQEEQLARMRYEEQQQMEESMSMDGPTVMVPIQGGDGRWQVPEVATQDYMMEPYMASGYEELARSSMSMAYKPAMDPVYKTACLPIDYKSAHMPIDWAIKRQQAMEDQYGAFAQCRMDY